MSKMIKCRTCGTDIAKNAKSCPSCGGKNKKPIFKRWWFILIAVIVIIAALASNGNKDKKADTTKETVSASNENADTAASTTDTKDSKETTKKQDNKITYENFLNIKMGQSYDEVVALLGEGKELSSSSVGDIKTTMYIWNGSGMGNLNVTIQGGVVVIKAQAFLQDNDAKITMDLYNKIENGMTYDQVKAILGEGELTSETKIMDSVAKMYSYINKDGSNANFTFSNGSMEMKAQFNLK